VPPAGPDGDPHDRWTSILDALELEVAATEAFLAECRHIQELPVSEPWRPPDGLGALPDELQPRADQVLARQLAVADEVARALASTRRQAAVVLRLQTGRDPARPAYLDQAL
jgi:hypothetical protein